LTTCNFRRLPPPRSPDDELAAEPWYGVGDDDIFPEQFINFVGVYGLLREAFLARHADLLDVSFWRTIQARVAAGEVMTILPYASEKRLRHANDQETLTTGRQGEMDGRPGETV